MENVKTSEFWGAPISVYTRAQAIKDGVLVDVTDTKERREAGFKYPTAVTIGVWTKVVTPPEEAKRFGESVEGRLWEVLWMLKVAIGKAKAKAARTGSNAVDDTVHFAVVATDQHGRAKVHKLWSRCHAGDTPAPVITIMLEGED